MSDKNAALMISKKKKKKIDQYAKKNYCFEESTLTKMFNEHSVNYSRNGPDLLCFEIANEWQ